MTKQRLSQATCFFPIWQVQTLPRKRKSSGCSFRLGSPLYASQYLYFRPLQCSPSPSLPFFKPCSLSRRTNLVENVPSRFCSASQLRCRPRPAVTAANACQVTPEEAGSSRVQTTKPKNYRCRQPRVGQRPHRVHQAWACGHGHRVSTAYIHPGLSAILTSPSRPVCATLSTASLRCYPPNLLRTILSTLTYPLHLIPTAFQRIYSPSNPRDRTRSSCTQPMRCFWLPTAPVFRPFLFSLPVLPHFRSSSSKSLRRTCSLSSKSSSSPNRTRL